MAHADRRTAREPRSAGGAPQRGVDPPAARSRSGAPGGDGPRSAQEKQPQLSRTVRTILLVEAGLLVALGVAGVVVSGSAGLTAQPETHVLWFRMNLGHSLLLLVTGAAIFAVCRWHRALKRFAWVQTAVYLGLFVFGTAFSAGQPSATALDLNTADHILHAALGIFGVVAVMSLNAHWLDPQLDPPAYGAAQNER